MEKNQINVQQSSTPDNSSFVSTFSFVIIFVLSVLSIRYLLSFGYGNFLEMYDNAAHLASMRGFYKVGLFSPVNYWLYAPGVYPLNYPPLFHLAGSVLLNVFPMEVISRWYFFLVYPLFLLTVFFTARKINGLLGAVATLLCFGGFVEVAEKSFGYAPLVLSNICGLLSLIFFLRNKIISLSFLLLGVLTHLNGVLFLWVYAVYSIIDLPALKKSIRPIARFSPGKKIALAILLGGLFSGAALIMRERILFLDRDPNYSLWEHIFSPLPWRVLVRDIPSFCLTVPAAFGLFSLWRRKEKLWFSFLAAYIFFSLVVGGRMLRINLLMAQSFLIGTVAVAVYPSLVRKLTEKKALIVLCCVAALMVFIPDFSAPYRYTLGKASWVTFFVPQVRLEARLNLPLDERTDMIKIIKNSSDIDDLVFIEASHNTQNYFFAFSGRVPLSDFDPRHMDIFDYTYQLIERKLPLFWISLREPLFAYEKIREYPSGYGLYILTRKDLARKLDISVIR